MPSSRVDGELRTPLVILRETQLRAVRLDFVVRLRRLGWWPWIALMLWCLFAASQEPQLLRAFGAFLTGQAGHAGGVLVLACLLALAPADLPMTLHCKVSRRLVLGTGLAGLVGGLQALCAGLAELVVTGRLPWFEAAQSGAWFVLAWTPAATAFAMPVSGPSRIGSRVLVGAPALCSLAIATGCWRGAPAAWLAVAALFAVAGAVFATWEPARRPAGATCA